MRIAKPSGRFKRPPRGDKNSSTPAAQSNRKLHKTDLAQEISFDPLRIDIGKAVSHVNCVRPCDGHRDQRPSLVFQSLR